MGDGYQYKLGKNFPITFMDTVKSKKSQDNLTPIQTKKSYKNKKVKKN